jgi:hypothetical protein
MLSWRGSPWAAANLAPHTTMHGDLRRLPHPISSEESRVTVADHLYLWKPIRLACSLKHLLQTMS